MRNSIRKSEAKLMVSGRLARARKSGPGDPEVVNEKFDQELTTEMDGFRKACQI